MMHCQMDIILVTGAYMISGYNNNFSVDEARKLARDFKHYKCNGGNSFYEYSFEHCELFIDFATVLSIMFSKPEEVNE